MRQREDPALHAPPAARAQEDAVVTQTIQFDYTPHEADAPLLLAETAHYDYDEVPPLDRDSHARPHAHASAAATHVCALALWGAAGGHQGETG